MKSFTNRTEQIVQESINGLLINENLAKLDQFPEIKVIVRTDWDKSKVALISGGGSGHEPAHAGFVGEGMLTAAVCGEIFASPTVDAVLSAIIAVTGEAGCLLKIKNYTGDRLNFGLAAEQARALGYKVETVTVADDIALGLEVKKRGIAGTLFVHKIAGYYASIGGSLKEVAKIAQEVANNTASIGLAHTECQPFGTKREIRLKEDEIEIGLGIHGEPGVDVIKNQNIDSLLKITTDKLKKHFNDKNNNYAILINNLGTVTPIEMSIITHSFTKTEIAKQTKYIIGPAALMTALNMNGFSISALKLNAKLETGLLAPVTPEAWPKAKKINSPKSVNSPSLPKLLPFKPSENKKTKQIISQIANTFISIESEINELDAKVGDADAGTTFSSVSKNILQILDKLPLDNIKETLESIGRIFSREAGGSSGVLLSILFTGSANHYENDHHLGRSLLAGLEKVKKYGGAKLGDRTMIDALEPAFIVLSNNGSINEAATLARKGTESTKLIKQTLHGRSSYIPESILLGIQDPGAEAMARVLEKLAITIKD